MYRRCSLSVCGSSANAVLPFPDNKPPIDRSSETLLIDQHMSAARVDRTLAGPESCGTGGVAQTRRYGSHFAIDAMVPLHMPQGLLLGDLQHAN